MIIVVEVILNATVAFVDFTATFHWALVGGFGSPQVVAKCLNVKVQPHFVNGHCCDRKKSGLHYFRVRSRNHMYSEAESRYDEFNSDPMSLIQLRRKNVSKINRSRINSDLHTINNIRN